MEPVTRVKVLKLPKYSKEQRVLAAKLLKIRRFITTFKITRKNKFAMVTAALKGLSGADYDAAEKLVWVSEFTGYDLPTLFKFFDRKPLLNSTKMDIAEDLFELFDEEMSARRYAFSEKGSETLRGRTITWKSTDYLLRSKHYEPKSKASNSERSKTP